MKRSTLRWFGHTEWMENEEFVKKVYLSSVEGPNRRERPLGRWKDRVKELVSERGARGNGLKWARKARMDRELLGGGPSFVAAPMGNASGGSEALKLLID